MKNAKPAEKNAIKILYSVMKLQLRISSRLVRRTIGDDHYQQPSASQARNKYLSSYLSCARANV